MKTFFTNMKIICKRAVHYLFPIWIASFDEFISTAREFNYKITAVERFHPIATATDFDYSSPYLNHGGFYFLELRGKNENRFDIRHLFLLGSTFSEGENFFQNICEQIKNITQMLKELKLTAES